MKSTISLYDKFGGEEGIAKVVEKFYEFILSDPTINHFFQNIKMEKHYCKKKLQSILNFSLKSYY